MNNGTPKQVRRLQNADLDGVVELIHRNWDEVLVEFHSAEIVALFRSQMSVPVLREQMHSKAIFVVEDGDDIAATGALADFGSEGQSKYCISNLFVRPDRQGRGCGALLVDHLLGLAISRNIAKLHVPSTRVAIPFYARFGFVVDAVQPDTALEMTWMRKVLHDA